MKAPHDMWRYSVDGPRLFKSGEEIPKGYYDSPAKVPPKKHPNVPRKPKEA